MYQLTKKCKTNREQEAPQDLNKFKAKLEGSMEYVMYGFDNLGTSAC